MTNRLTKKDKNGKYYTVATELGLGGKLINPITSWIEDCEERNFGNPINKLGSLEDLLDQYNVKDLEELDKLLTMATSYEELSKQVGCPLDVFIKLAKQVKINFNGPMTGYFVFYNLIHKRFEIRNEETMDLFPLSDYKKTWWLKEDKSE